MAIPIPDTCPACGGSGRISGRPDLALIPKRNETPPQKAARTKAIRRVLSEEALAVSFAALIRGGFTSESARKHLGIGDVKAKRVRAAAVRFGFLRRRHRNGKHPR